VLVESQWRHARGRKRRGRATHGDRKCAVVGGRQSPDHQSPLFAIIVMQTIAQQKGSVHGDGDPPRRDNWLSLRALPTNNNETITIVCMLLANMASKLPAESNKIINPTPTLTVRLIVDVFFPCTCASVNSSATALDNLSVCLSVRLSVCQMHAL